jgi:hypothetical protein
MLESGISLLEELDAQCLFLNNNNKNPNVILILYYMLEGRMHNAHFQIFCYTARLDVAYCPFPDIRLKAGMLKAYLQMRIWRR